mmetsp:Transcript_80736/g.228724  ORF Transcript_80736/g.228724 Transcript_80736/m.228724 type:complete len:279 (+) Transcript_80736:51-887(+)
MFDTCLLYGGRMAHMRRRPRSLCVGCHGACRGGAPGLARVLPDGGRRDDLRRPLLALGELQQLPLVLVLGLLRLRPRLEHLELLLRDQGLPRGLPLLGLRGAQALGLLLVLVRELPHGDLPRLRQGLPLGPRGPLVPLLDGQVELHVQEDRLLLRLAPPAPARAALARLLPRRGHVDLLALLRAEVGGQPPLGAQVVEGGDGELVPEVGGLRVQEVGRLCKCLFFRDVALLFGLFFLCCSHLGVVVVTGFANPLLFLRVALFVHARVRGVGDFFAAAL